MKSKIDKILDAHVEHDLQHFQGEALKHKIEEDSGFWIDWALKRNTEDILTEKQILDIIKYFVVDFPIGPGAIEIAGEMSRAVLTAPINTETKLQDIFPRHLWDTVIEFAVDLKHIVLNHAWKKLVISSSIRLLSGTLYQALKEFLLTENILVKGVTKLSPLLRKGEEVLNKRFPSFEASLENHAREFIDKNADTLIALIEKHLDELVDDEFIVEMGDEIWDEIFSKEVSRHYGQISPDDIEDFIVFGYDFWLNFRKTKYFNKLYTKIVELLYYRYGSKPFEVFIDDIGGTREMIVDSVQKILIPLFEQAVVSGVLEQRIRASLKTFYGSEKFNSIMSE